MKKVWWKCNKGHEWKARVSKRMGGHGCPYCSWMRVCSDNNLAVREPRLASEWNAERNRKITPYNVTIGSKKNVWWKCKKGHEWQATVNTRVSRRAGCPVCAGKVTIIETGLLTKYTEDAKLWHPTKNSPLSPTDVNPKSGKKVWWKCEKGHEYQNTVAHQTEPNRGCPVCSGRKVTATKHLAYLHPEIVSDWHPTKNNGLNADNYRPGSQVKVWWKCPKGHKWLATVKARNRGSGCPKCRWA